jgi:uncharacterized protein YecE (DUF72 family)
MIRIGCSGWQYKHWKGDFYPAGLREADWLDWYARSFDTVELNNSFYRLPEKRTFQGWHERSPPGFLFAVKASRYLTHLKKLKDPEEPLRRFFERAEALGSKLGPILYQLPPRWPADVDRLRAFVRCLPKPYRHAIEFRDSTWYAAGVLEVLESHDVALCLHDMHGSATGRQRLGPFVYVRFHGTTKYGGRYGDDELGGWAEWIRAEHGAGRDVFAYFNNDVGGHAPRDAMRLRELVAG